MNLEKNCTKCGLSKPATEFPTRSDNNKKRNICCDCWSAYKKYRYYSTHDHSLQVKKKYRENPINKNNRRKWDKEKRNSDLNHKLRCNLRGRLVSAVKNESKSGSAVRDLGCSISEFKIYLESKFYSNPETNEMMTWNNYGRYGWHIDHIKPLASFDLEDREQFLQACHYANLQPMWSKENIKKGNRC